MNISLSRAAAVALFALSAAACTANVENPSLNQTGKNSTTVAQCTKTCDDNNTTCTAKCSDDTCKASCTTTHDNCVTQCQTVTTTSDGG
jgi:hypothetical protein